LCVAAEFKSVPGNLHFNDPQPKLKELDGLIQIVCEPLTVKEGDLCGVSSFGFGGTNAHAVVKLLGSHRHERGVVNGTSSQKDEAWMNISPVYGRTEEAVRKVLDTGVLSSVPMGKLFFFVVCCLFSSPSLRPSFIEEGRHVSISLSWSSSQWKSQSFQG
jgi:Ketoacyl-synthetase C-terminal extension